MCKLKVALLERRFGSHDPRHSKNEWRIRSGVEWYNNDQVGQGNTFAFIDAFGDVMTGPLESGSDYSVVKDYDLLYVRLRDHNCAKEVKQLRETCPNPVIIAYSDELVGSHINDLRYHDSWMYDASLYVDVLTSSFPAKYDRPKHEKLGITNWQHLPYAGDVNHWKQWYNSNKHNIVAGMWHIRSFMRGGCGTPEHQQTFDIMRQLRNRFGVELRFFLNFDGHKVVPRIRKYIGNLEVELVPHMNNPEFNTLLAETKVFLEEYQCPNYARSTVVSACVGTPQVGTDMNTPSNILFPETTVTHNDWGGFIARCERLLTDQQFYNDVQARALKRSSYFYYPRFRGRILRMYNKILKQRNL